MAEAAAVLRSAAADDVMIQMVNVHKWYGQFHVLKDIDLTVYKGERIVICGPSGSGKSTLIRCINRLEEHQKGKIIVDGIELSNDLKNIEQIRREVGMVFQHFNLFPHLTVLENCTLAPIWVRRMPKAEAEKAAMKYLERVRIPEQASPERIEAPRARADKALAEARSGLDFASVAASYSDAPDAISGGALGWRSHERLPELFADALKDMQPGQVSELLRSPAGFHVVKLLGRRGAGEAAPVAQTHARHILVKTNEVVSEDDARRRLATLRERIVAGADFAGLARLNSEDGTAARGGDLGWVYPGDTVPEFERAMNALAPGEISPPVRTPFGFHLIQVLERRTADMSAERQRLQARQALRERKADEAYQDWLRQLRDRTYVDLRLDER